MNFSAGEMITTVVSLASLLGVYDVYCRNEIKKTLKRNPEAYDERAV